MVYEIVYMYIDLNVFIITQFVLQVCIGWESNGTFGLRFTSNFNVSAILYKDIVWIRTCILCIQTDCHGQWVTQTDHLTTNILSFLQYNHVGRWFNRFILANLIIQTSVRQVGTWLSRDLANIRNPQLSANYTKLLSTSP